MATSTRVSVREVATNRNPDQSFDFHVELTPMKRPEEKVVAAGRHAEVGVLLGVPVPDEQHRGGLQVGGADDSAEIRPRHPAKVEPEDDEARTVRLYMVPRLFARGHGSDVVRRATQHGLLKHQRDSRVVDKKNPLSHGHSHTHLTEISRRRETEFFTSSTSRSI